VKRKLVATTVVSLLLAVAPPAAANTVDATTSLGTLTIRVANGTWTSDQCQPVAVSESFRPAVNGANYSTDFRRLVCPDTGSGRHSLSFTVTMWSPDQLMGEQSVGVSTTFTMAKMKTATLLTKATRAGSFAGTVSDGNSGTVVIQRKKRGRWQTVTRTTATAGKFQVKVAKRFPKGTQFRASFRQTQVAMASLSALRAVR
jgi:hypothetical protein